MALFDWLKRGRAKKRELDESAGLAAMYRAPKLGALPPENPDGESELDAPAGGGTENERARLEEALVQQNLDELLKAVALWAVKNLEQSPGNAWELAQRALTRCWETCAWDPRGEDTLAAVLCAIVRSLRSTDARSHARRIEVYEQYAQQHDVLMQATTRSPEEQMLHRARRRAEQRRAKWRVVRLRRSFQEARDDVNVQWLELSLRGYETAREMAEVSGRPEKDFYAAAKRRVRHVERLKQQFEDEKTLDESEMEDEREEESV